MKIYKSYIGEYRILKKTFADGNVQYYVQSREFAVDFIMKILRDPKAIFASIIFIPIVFVIFFLCVFCWANQGNYSTKESAEIQINDFITAENKEVDDKRKKALSKKVIKKEHL